MRALASAFLSIGVSVVGSLSVWCAADLAQAQACEPGEAGLRFDEAHDAYDDDDLPLAATLLERSVGCEETSEALYDLYVVREQQQLWGQAAEALETYLESEPPLIPERRRELESWLEELQDRDHPAPEPERPFDMRGDEGWQIGGGVMLGVGLAGLVGFGISGAFLIAVQTSDCPTLPCTPAVAAQIRELEVATWTTLGLGAALTGVGLIITLVSGSWTQGSTTTLPSSLDPSRRLEWQPMSLQLDFGPGTVVARGRF